MTNSFIPWVEKYRPQELGEVIGNDKIVSRLRAYVSTKNLPNLLFAGPAGSGKTTCALAIARGLFGENYQQSFLELNSSDERGIDVVRGKIKDFARTMPVTDVPYKILLLDEGDSLTPEAQQALRRTMEKYSSNTRFVISANYSSRIIEPIQSRCALFRFSQLTSSDLKALMERISRAEGLKLADDAVEALLYVSQGDGRKLINCLQGCSAVSSDISAESVYSVSSRARPQEVQELLLLSLQGKFAEARKILDKLLFEYGLSGQDVVIQLFQEVNKSEIEDKTKLLLMEKIGECDFRISEGANDRIQIEALLAGFALVKSA
ncbi:replication factor C small subunit [Candidatus Micrarchaeota archaeon]|nr:replication factor C small subunit [Candidatus Micrarchaeota archaeon]